MLWGAVTGFSIVSIGAVAVFLIWLVMRVLVFLQPVLVPLAVAGIIAYLLEPLIRKLTDRGAPRTRAMLIIFSSFHLMILLLATMVVVPAVRQSSAWFENREVADIVENVRTFSDKAFGSIDTFWERFSLSQASPEKPKPVAPPVAPPVSGTGASSAAISSGSGAVIVRSLRWSRPNRVHAEVSGLAKPRAHACPPGSA